MTDRVSCHPGAATIPRNCRQMCFTVNISEVGWMACQQFFASHVKNDNYPTPKQQLTPRWCPANIAAVLPAGRRAACRLFGPTVSLKFQRPSENVFVMQCSWARRRCMLDCSLMVGWGQDSENSTGGTRECWKNTDCSRAGLQGFQHSLLSSPMYWPSSGKKHWPERVSACRTTPDLLLFGK